MTFPSEEHRKQSSCGSPFPNLTFTRNLYNKSPQSLNQKKIKDSLNLREKKGYKSPLSSEIYGDWSSEIKKSSKCISDTNFHTPLSFPLSETQKNTIQKLPVGFWRHPSLDIIFKRIRKTGVKEETLKRLIVNILAIVIIHWVKNYINKRFIRPKDTFLDLSLTPIQRKLFGLDPDVFTSSPSNNSITPPRYTKSSPRSRQSPRLSPQQITPYNEGSQTSHSNSETKNPSKPSPLRNELSSPTFTNLNIPPTSFLNENLRDRTSFMSNPRYLNKRYSLDSFSP
ncbi:hypothetical protein PMAC_002661 [Pneumocystis sp. 'macacae']|nr:hypothetical protein PMAC_002661 [Pneumocystis sp. 'macacae']